jgi:hypothetical protein
MMSFVRTLAIKARAIVFAVVALALLAPSASGAEGSGSNGWVSVRNEDGISVSRREIPGSAFLALKGEGDVDRPLLLVGSVFMDLGRNREWVDSVVDTHVVRSIDASEYVTYSHVGAPVVIADRDFVTRVKLEVDAAAKRLTIHMQSVSDPLAPKTHHVRGEIMESTVVLTAVDGGRRTHVVAEIHADPKGNVPAWVVNWFQRDWGYNTLKRLRAQVAKPDIQVNRALKTLLEVQGYFGVPEAPRAAPAQSS